jgi:hypothetical protein
LFVGAGSSPEKLIRARITTLLVISGVAKLMLQLCPCGNSANLQITLIWFARGAACVHVPPNPAERELVEMVTGTDCMKTTLVASVAPRF